MSIIIYKIDAIKTPNINIYITKNNKKPLHNKAYREVWTLLSENNNIGVIYLYIEHCLCIQYNIVPKYAYNLKPSYIHISDLNNKYLKELTCSENIELQNRFLNRGSSYLISFLSLLNMAIYNNENKYI